LKIDKEAAYRPLIVNSRRTRGKNMQAIRAEITRKAALAVETRGEESSGGFILVPEVCGGRRRSPGLGECR
jgi:hypothetical protein